MITAHVSTTNRGASLRLITTATVSSTGAVYTLHAPISSHTTITQTTYQVRLAAHEVSRAGAQARVAEGLSGERPATVRASSSYAVSAEILLT